MKESKLYLTFFKKNLLFLFLPAVVFASLGFLYISNIPAVFKTTRLLELTSKEEQIPQKTAEVDQAVTLIRSANIQKSIGVSDRVKLNAFKNAPLLLVLETFSQDQQQGLNELNKANVYLNSKYDFQRMGQDITLQASGNLILSSLLGAALGFLVGLVFVLIRTYFKNY